MAWGYRMPSKEEADAQAEALKRAHSGSRSGAQPFGGQGSATGHGAGGSGASGDGSDARPSSGSQAEDRGASGGEARGTSGAPHSSKDYKDAVSTVVDIIEESLGSVPSDDVVARSWERARASIPRLRQAVAVMPASTSTGATVGQPADVVGTVNDAAARSGHSATMAVADAMRGVVNPVSKAVAGMQAQRSRRDARQNLVQYAALYLSFAKFEEMYGARTDAAVVSPSARQPLPGCYAIFRKGEGYLRDFSDFTDVYVGASGDVWASLGADLAGSGNPGIHAAAKERGADLQVIIYPCKEELTERLRDALVIALDADVSCNAIGSPSEEVGPPSPPIA